MMQVDTVTEQIRKFIVEHFPLARKLDPNNDDRLLEKGIIDSLGILELVAFVEHEFQITMTDEELLPENFRSIKDLAAFVQSKLTCARARQSKE
jgi:acyl carrier protein